MGLFGKKEKNNTDERPTLAELPKLPELPDMQPHPPQAHNSQATKLPKFPSNSFGTKFSQDSIKEAVTGKRGEEDSNANDFSDEGMMPGTPKAPMTQEVDEKVPSLPPRTKMPSQNYSGNPTSMEGGPMFVRIDKFEEGLKIFDETRSKLLEIEGLLNDIKRVRDKEDQELQAWDQNIQTMKTRIEKVNKDIFSKI